MADLSLSARPRTLTGRHAAQLRRQGQVPAVLYGHRQTTTSIEADAKTLERLWARAGKTTLFDLVVEGGRTRKVIFREVQIHPRSGRAVHADLFAPNLREKIQADIPVVLTGEAPAVEQRIGQVLQVAQTIRVESLPTDLPHQLVGDVSGLVDASSQVTAAEVKLPQGVALLSDPGEVLATIATPRVQVVEEEEAEAAAAAAESEAAAEGGEGAPATGADAGAPHDQGSSEG